MPNVDGSDSLVTRNLTVEDLLKLGTDTPLEFDEQAKPSTPQSGNVRIYSKTDGFMYSLDDLGVETLMSIAPQFARGTAFIYISAPQASEDFPVVGVPDAATITAVRHITASGTVDWNLEERTKAAPYTSGTNVFTSDKQSTSTTANETSFANASLANDSCLFYSSSATSSGVNLLLFIDWTVNV